MQKSKEIIFIVCCFVIIPIMLGSFGCCKKSPIESKTDYLISEVWNTELLGPQFFPEVDDPIYKVPWLADRKSFGIAFSGGGTRSASATLGQLRALYELGWLQKARYISAISGGAWAAVPYTYYSGVDDQKILGKYIAPMDLTTNDIESSPRGSLVRAIDKSAVLGKTFKDWLCLEKDETYSSVIGKIFLRKFGLNDERYFAFHENSVRQILQNNQFSGLSINDFHTVKEGRPFLIVGGTFISKKDGKGSSNFYPLEMSGLYVGMRSKKDAETKRGIAKIGGGYVQPHVYDTDTPIDFGNGKVKSPLGSKRKNFTLRDVVGITGAAPQHSVLRHDIENVGFPELEYWPIDQDTKAYEFYHGDGGHIENMGLMPLLVRKVKNIIVFSNSDRALGDKDKLDIKSYFASVPASKRSPGYQKNVVFEAKKYDELIKGFKNKEGKEPLVYCDEYDVAANNHYGIEPYKANICWIYLNRNEQWISQVEKSSVRKKHIKRLVEKESSFERFPHYRTFEENPPYVINLSRYQVNALAHMTAWTVCKSKETIAEALRSDGLELPIRNLDCE